MPRWSDNLALIGLRSLLFHLVAAAVTLIFLLLYPLILLPRRLVWAIMRRYIATQLWLLRVICGLGYRFEGAEHVPAGACILASRHEAAWETLFLPLVFDNPAVILKSEILSYPIAGPLARKLGFIGVERAGSADSIKATFARARKTARSGRSLLIFPSGTRDPAHKYRVQGGVSVLYRMLNLPCVPIVLDSGDFWLHRRWLRRPGVITVRVLPPIPTGLRAADFQTRLEADLARPA